MPNFLYLLIWAQIYCSVYVIISKLNSGKTKFRIGEIKNTAVNNLHTQKWSCSRPIFRSEERRVGKEWNHLHYFVLVTNPVRSLIWNLKHWFLWCWIWHHWMLSWVFIRSLLFFGLHLYKYNCLCCSCVIGLIKW